MFLKNLFLQNFRNYSKINFNFSESTMLIVGPNTAGKSNLIEAIFFLASGKSFRVDKGEQLIKFNHDIARISGKIGDIGLDVVIVNAGAAGNSRAFKRYSVQGVNKRKFNFIGNFFAVLFAPSDLEIIIGSPSKRRSFIDNILIQTDRDYRLSIGFYEKGLRVRNALLYKAREKGIRSEKEFEYWDNLLITQGQKITRKREELVEHLNAAQKDIFDFETIYDKSLVSRERLMQYESAELASGVTLVGPHRDDLEFRIQNPEFRIDTELKYFGSRGQQRLTILQLKLLELNYIEQKTEIRPVLLLDDIFSELDERHINLILNIIKGQQTIITTTHEEFIPKKLLKRIDVIKLGDYGKRS